MLGVDPEYAAIYADESDEKLREVRTQLARLEVQPDDVETLRVVRQLIHNLKGAAGTVGFKLAATLAHRMEDVLDRIGDGAAALAGETLSLVYHAVDALEDLAGRSFDNDAMSRRLAELFPRLSAAMTVSAKAPTSTEVRVANVAQSETTVAANEDRLAPAQPVTAITRSAASPSNISLVEATDSHAIERRVVDLIESLQPAFIDIDGAAPALPALNRHMPMTSNTTANSNADATPESTLSSGDAARILITKLDGMVKLLSELVVNRTSFEQRMSHLISVVDELKFSLSRLDEMSHKFATQYEAKTLGGKALPWAKLSKEKWSHQARRSSYRVTTTRASHRPASCDSTSMRK